MWNERIKQARIEKGLTQREVAEKCGMSERQYQFYETGTRCPSLLNAKRITDALEISLDWILSSD